MFELDKIYLGDNVTVLKEFPDECIDLTVTSPPYDAMRSYGDTYKGYDFNGLVKQLFRVTKDGGVVVWVVGDMSYKNGETGNSFRQALGFMDTGFKLYDTMIYAKTSTLVVSKARYTQIFEYMFVFAKLVKKKAINAFNPIMVSTVHARENRTAAFKKSASAKEIRSASVGMKPLTVVRDYKIKGNIWYYNTGKYHNTDDSIAYKHPAIFPDKLAEDRIISWSNAGDVVLDPFAGSGTTCVVAKRLKRHYIGIEINKDYVYIIKSRLE